MIENNIIFCLEFSVFLYFFLRLNFLKEFNGGKINFFGGFVYILGILFGFINFVKFYRCLIYVKNL